VSAAADLLRESVPLSTQLANAELLAHALRGLAGVAHARHELARAAELLGAAQALSDAEGTVDWPVRRKLYRRIEDDTLKELGGTAFAENVAAGRALNLREAADFALAAVEPAVSRAA
jgi:hypothetical protein